MMSPAKEEATMEPVDISEGSSPVTMEPDQVVVDPWAVDEDAIINDADAAAAASTTTGEHAPPSDTAEAISKLKISSKRLVTNLDQKLNLSGAWNALGNSVKQIDQQTHVSQTVKTGVSGVGSWISTVDKQFQISEKGKEIGSSIGSILPSQELSTGIQKSTRAIQSFDESHKITATVSSTLATGAELLATTIGGSRDAGSAPVDQVNDVDKDGLPTSFEK